LVNDVHLDLFYHKSESKTKRSAKPALGCSDPHKGQTRARSGDLTISFEQEKAIYVKRNVVNAVTLILWPWCGKINHIDVNFICL